MHTIGLEVKTKFRSMIRKGWLFVFDKKYEGKTQRTKKKHRYLSLITSHALFYLFICIPVHILSTSLAHHLLPPTGYGF